MIVQALSPILSTTMLASQSLKGFSSMFLSSVIDKICLVLGTKATTRFSALQFHLCLHEHPFSPFFQFILLQYFQFFCFRIQFDDSVLNNGLPIITILCYFSPVLVNLAPLLVLGDNICSSQFLSSSCTLACFRSTNQKLPRYVSCYMP